jgi:hypothetical protein
MLQLGKSTPQTPTAHAFLREKVEGLFEQLHLPIFRYAHLHYHGSAVRCNSKAHPD